MKIILTESQLKNATPGWKMVKGALTKKYKFDSFKEVLDFVNKVGGVAEKQNHHPDMKISYDEVVVSIFDHEKNKISDKCYKFIRAVEKLKK
jgi:4a-hydroxytetrahydrobiopterin dehydratase